MTQIELRNLFCERLKREKQCYISKVTGIDKNTLSLFKNGRLAELYPKHFEALKAYLTNKQ